MNEICPEWHAEVPDRLVAAEQEEEEDTEDEAATNDEPPELPKTRAPCRKFRP